MQRHLKDLCDTIDARDGVEAEAQTADSRDREEAKDDLKQMSFFYVNR
jgi:hypothetical protein